MNVSIVIGERKRRRLIGTPWHANANVNVTVPFTSTFGFACHGVLLRRVRLRIDL